MRSTCTITGCKGNHYGKGYCVMHYKRFIRHGDPLYVRPVKLCGVDGRGKNHLALGFCGRHYRQLPEVRAKIVAYSKTDKFRAVSRASQKRHWENPKRKVGRDAARLVFSTIKKGILERMPCEVCGVPCAEAHHHSYLPEAWLAVMWLCHKHHKDWHTKHEVVYF